jgi:hypothetical protein
MNEQKRNRFTTVASNGPTDQENNCTRKISKQLGCGVFTHYRLQIIIYDSSFSASWAAGTLFLLQLGVFK